MAIHDDRLVDTTAHLTVLVDRHGRRVGVWDRFLADVSRVLGLTPSFALLPGVDGGWIEAVLDRAASADGPVLVLPGVAPSGAEAHSVTWPTHLQRAVIASDDSVEAAGGARLCALHLLRHGVQTKVVLVLTAQTAPPMWEGAGHQAAAWRAELGRRYRPADSLEVCSGSPGAAVRSRAAGADLVVLLWHRSGAPGRAKVVRAVLDDGIHRPCLLVPLPWVTHLEHRMESVAPRRRAAAGV